jgi:hypothetical protein
MRQTFLLLISLHQQQLIFNDDVLVDCMFCHNVKYRKENNLSLLSVDVELAIRHA